MTEVRNRKGAESGLHLMEKDEEAFEHKNVVSLRQSIFHAFYPVDILNHELCQSTPGNTKLFGLSCENRISIAIGQMRPGNPM